ncbi:2-hydroxychromene-2-carboxylate isomerase [Stella humosa]|uniref:2-hydroxychromene-2-carboxylate isomerase n=1 Tax=Stella humosa TaxID=94 RepID=A0A3N1M206_9PROT|nr:2-hydroxychromene-2-carboxylate isomerase [Stella humosa]ROP99751.1 2-hydroxychromene-2-carboxylate isomerase [Stella humosa]
MNEIEFWYEFASPYAYLAAARIERLVAGTPLRLTWRPLLLGPIFQRRPGHASPFQEPAPAESAYRRRDAERCAVAQGTPLAWPSIYPRSSLLAARVALLGGDEGWIAPFSQAVYRASFMEDRDIAAPETVLAILGALDLPGQAIVARATQPAHKARLASTVEEAVAKGIFGAPSLVAAGEVFWGNDRLEQAIDWALHPALRFPRRS